MAVAVTPVVGPARRPTTRRPTQTQVRPSLVTSTKLIFHLCGRCPVRTTRPEKVSAPPTPNRHAHSVLGHRFARRSRRQTDTLITATVSPAPSLPRPPKSGVGQKLRKIVSFTFFLMGGGFIFARARPFSMYFFFCRANVCCRLGFLLLFYVWHACGARNAMAMARFFLLFFLLRSHRMEFDFFFRIVGPAPCTRTPPLSITHTQ